MKRKVNLSEVLPPQRTPPQHKRSNADYRTVDYGQKGSVEMEDMFRRTSMGIGGRIELEPIEMKEIQYHRDRIEQNVTKAPKGRKTLKEEIQERKLMKHHPKNTKKQMH